MQQSNDLNLLTIEQLFSENSHYIIPIYQRNYAWGAPEIEQLIRDIADASEHRTGQKYFLGSLVVYVRDNVDSAYPGKAIYETIDGQQRHTTLSILLAYLTLARCGEQELSRLHLNLGFDSRPKSTRTLQNLFKPDEHFDPEEPSIRAAFTVIERYFKTQHIDIAEFSQYLLKHVTILRVAVPKDTDLNHYFEIMNNRGEQLEKHEVLKANLMSVFNGETAARNCFSAIWDACADMSRYVQLGFSSQARKTLFGEKWLGFPADFEAIKCAVETKPDTDEKLTLREIIEKRRFHHNDDNDEKAKEQRFDSIIDFSNFLLHVLKITADADNAVSLDDKKLLQAFEIIKNDREKITLFAFNLLKFRVLFDRYIIKRDQAEKWSLLTIEYYSHSSFSYNNSFGTDELPGLNTQLAMILSMFHVSHPAYVYKRWLNRSLAILNTLALGELSVDGKVYLSELEQLSHEFLSDICGEKEQFNAGILNRGTGVQNFVFNLLDYRLWRDLNTGQLFDGKGLNNSEIKKHFDGFQFSQSRTSVEHYFPQTDPSGLNNKMEGDVHRFGNLCLISPSSNSRLSNYSPADKKKFYADTERAESLKQAIMMSYEEWGPEGSGIKNIESHEHSMLELLRGH